MALLYISCDLCDRLLWSNEYVPDFTPGAIRVPPCPTCVIQATIGNLTQFAKFSDKRDKTPVPRGLLPTFDGNPKQLPPFRDPKT